MKKIIYSFVFLVWGFCMLNTTYGLSEEFKFAIDTIGIPRYNTYGQEVNEDVYYTYNVFSYGEPHTTKDVNQRWKNSKYGYWTKSGGSYKGKGTRGEYYILGKSYSGALIYNYYFPMDVIPSTTPDKWTFYNYPGAEASWKDKTKYKYLEQLEHMKNSKLMFNDISSRAKADNPKYIKEYNITAKSIGLNKARLDVSATWKTYGMVSTRRKISGIIYAQVYLVKPMAAGANVVSSINVEEKYVLKETEDELVIPIEYKTEVANMSGYAKKEHIKEITSNLYINNKKIEEISGSKITSAGNEYLLVITRENFPPNEEYSVEILVDGYMHTEFVADGLMRAKTTKIVKVLVEPKLIIPVRQSNLKILEKDTLSWVVRPLAQISKDIEESVGFTEAGKTLVLKLDLNVPEEKIENINVEINDVKIDTAIYNTQENLALKLTLPKTLEPTLYGEYSLRQENGNYNKLNKDDIGKRIKEPHILRVEFEYNQKKFIEEIKFDTLDTYLSNINTKVISSDINASNYMSLNEWIGLKNGN